MRRRWRVLATALVPLAVRHLVTHRIATAVALLAVLCGVGAMVASQLMYRSVVASYETTARRFAGRAALQITNGASGVPEELADEIRDVPGVRRVTATVEELVSAPDLPGERLYLYGIDLLAEQESEYGGAEDAVVSDPLVFLAAADSVALTAGFAEAHGLRLHDRVRVATPAGVTELTVRAMLGAQRGLATALDGRVAVVDLSVAQALLKSEQRVSRLGVEVAPDAALDAVERAVARVVGGRGVVESPRSRTAAFARLLTTYRYGLLLAASTSVVVALYLVFNVVTIAVEERRRELGLLRTVGLRGRSAIGLVMAELLVLGLVASAAGIPAGVLLARLLAGRVGASVAALYLDVGVPIPQLDAPATLSGLALGLLMPLGAAIAPITRVRCLQPLEAVRPTVAEPQRQGGGLVLGLVGGITMASASLVWLMRGQIGITTETAGLAAMLGATIGIALAVPSAVRGLTVGLDVLASRYLGALAMLAGRRLRAESRDVAITCAAVLVGVAGAIAAASWVTSLDRTLHAAFDTVFGGVDLVVSAGADPFAAGATRIAPNVVAALQGIPGVERADAVRITSIAFEGGLVSVIAADARAYARGQRALSMVEGESLAVGGALASGSGVVVNQAFVSRFHRRRGDLIGLPSPAGLVRARIVGVHLELTPGDLPVVRMDQELYRRGWRDETANLVELALARDADGRQVARVIRERLGMSHRLVVFTLEQMRREYAAMLRHLTALVYPLLAVGVVVALIGVASARITSMLGRLRTSAMLRALGLTRAQLVRVFVLEAVIVGAVATVLAIVTGSILGALQVAILLRGMLGMSILYAYPQGGVLACGATLMLLAALIGGGLGRHAGRPVIAEALRWE